MSYLVLARKWRPQTFDDVVGQQPVVRTLQNALSRNRVAHAMIFSGVRGVGKTTLARIMAKALNCQDEKIRPCNRCESCRQITDGSAIDLHEIDGASNRGIQEIRELKENIRFFPVTGRYKVIIIDEVHMLTTEAFNALLKTLEEPPEHVYFMFATTEIHKVPITILSRCQRYELRRIPHAELAAFFKKIAVAEEVSIAGSALELIAREAEGSVRDGLSLLDQVLSFGGEDVTVQDVAQVLGVVDRQVFETLCRTLLAGDLAASLSILNKSFDAGMDLKRFSNDLLGYFRAVMVAKLGSQAQMILDLSDHDLAAVREIASNTPAQTLYHFFYTLLKGIEEMQYSPHPRLVLEMAFIRAVQVGDVVPVTALLARLDVLLQGQPDELSTADQKKKIEPVAAEDLVPPGALPALSESSSPLPSSAVVVADPDKSARITDVHGVVSRREVKESWDDFLVFVDGQKKWIAQALRRNSGVWEENGILTVKFDESADCLLLQEAEHVRIVTEFAQDFFQRELKVRFVVTGRLLGEEDHAGDKPREDRRALAHDSLVQLATEVFGGQVVAIRTGSRNR